MALKFNPFTGKLDFTGSGGGGGTGTVTSITAGTGLIGGTITTSGTISVNPVYSLEIHVSKDGNDTTGDGTLLNPVLTITKALTLVGAGKNTVIVHPGGYTESPTVTSTNTTIATSELTGANTLLTGTLTLNAAARVSGLKMSNLTITGSGNTYISNCTVDTRVIKSGSNYVEIINSELQCTAGVQITGAGTVSIVGNKCWSVAVSNAAANVLIKDCFQVITPSVSTGSLQFDGCAIFAAAPTTNAVTSSAGSFITLANSFILNSVGTSVERVSLAGSYSILNLVYDKANSTFTGTNLNAVDYFSVINAEKIGVNTVADATVGLKLDSTGVKFNDGTIQTTAATGTPSGTAGGDLAGTYPNPTVDGLQGNPVSNTAPSSGQVLQWNGTAWSPGAIPSGGSGGGGLVYFLNYQNTTNISPTTGLPTSPVAPSQLGRNYSVGSGSITSANLTQGSYSLICGFVTEASEPNVTDIPAGLWDFNIWADVSSASGNLTQFQIRVFKYNSTTGVYTSLANSDDIYIYDPSVIAQYIGNVTMPQTTILTTDRIYVELWAQKNVAGTITVSFYFDSLHPSHCHTTLPSVSGSGVAKVVNGVFQSPASTIVNADVSATAAIDQSKLNLTNAAADGATKGISAFAASDFDATAGVVSIDYTNGQAASASVKGFLTSADWTTFNSKGVGTVTSVTGTSPIASSGGATPAISIVDAAADGTTKGAAAFTASDFNATSGVVSIDYTNGQAASGSTKGFLTSTDWTTFNNKINGSTNIWIPASAWIPRTTTGCGVDSRELATNLTNYDELLFDPATNEFAQALTILPNNYNNSTITGRFYWTSSTGSGAVVWGLQGRAYADDDTLDAAFGTAQTVTDTLLATNDMHVTSATSAITIAGTPAANRPILFQIYRDAAAGGDTLASDARFLGVEILFN